MIKRGAGKSQVQVEKISRSKSGHPYSDPSKNKLFGSFALIYIIEGYVSIVLDENNKNEQTHELKAGQTLFIERDEESDPTSFSMSATDSREASVVIIKIEEGKTFGGIMPTKEKKPEAEKDQAEEDTGDIVPSKFRHTARRPSLLAQLEKMGNRVEPTRPLASLTTRRDSAPGLDSDVLSMLNGSFDSSGIYVPPMFALMHNETDMPPPVTRDKLEVTEFPIHAISTAWIKMMTHGLSEWIKLPVIVCRGTEDG
ncbi:hypothetical protein K501DRAFT_281256 [Backusella circina FSU 941]|nr:hypothetical protein K501DRAFT_281256 [Backusella circina FSU 941]